MGTALPGFWNTAIDTDVVPIFRSDARSLHGSRGYSPGICLLISSKFSLHRVNARPRHPGITTGFRDANAPPPTRVSSPPRPSNAVKASPTVPIPLLFPSFEEVQKVGPFGNVEGEGEAKNIFENTFRHKLILSFFKELYSPKIFKQNCFQGWKFVTVKGYRKTGDSVGKVGNLGRIASTWI